MPEHDERAHDFTEHSEWAARVLLRGVDRRVGLGPDLDEECPRISREFIDKKRRRMDDGYFRQEFQCEFHAADDQYFSPNIISKCLIDEWDGWIPEVFRENPGVAALIAAGASVARSEEARPQRV